MTLGGTIETKGDTTYKPKDMPRKAQETAREPIGITMYTVVSTTARKVANHIVVTKTMGTTIESIW